jgi:hypothetical protein
LILTLIDNDHFVDYCGDFLSDRRRRGPLGAEHDCLQLRAQLFGESPPSARQTLRGAIKTGGTE